jgi:hypothetical protein
MLGEIDKNTLLTILRSRHLPKPATWHKLMVLWAYIAPEITGYQRSYVSGKDLRIVPVQGKNVLYAANEVVRLGEKKLLQSEDDWEFLSKHLMVLNQNWPRFWQNGDVLPATKTMHRSQTLSKQPSLFSRRSASMTPATPTRSSIRSRLHSSLTRASVFSECVQLAQIAAKLGATVGESFHYVTWDEALRPANSTVLFDNGTLDELLPVEEREGLLLHPDYTASFTSCSREEWHRWITSGRSGLLTFIPLVQKRLTIFGQGQIGREARRRGHSGYLSYPYVTGHFIIEDWDFDDTFWEQLEGACLRRCARLDQGRRWYLVPTRERLDPSESRSSAPSSNNRENALDNV